MSPHTSRTAVGPVRTSVSAFLGDAPGLPDRPAFVRTPREFTDALSPDGTDERAPSFVRDAVLGHFRNGGGGAWILRAAARGGGRVAAYRAALAELAGIPDITLVVAPDLWRVAEDAPEIARALAGHCRRAGDRVALLHTRQGLAPAEMRARPFDLAEPDARCTAVYYPWITLTGADGRDRHVPPSGHVSGMCGRVDAEHGVHTPPLGALLGVVRQERDLSDAERERIGSLGVNCLRSVPEQSIRVAGARTLSTDPDWTHLGVRRLVNHARAALRRRTRWAAAEPDDERLRASVHRSATAFLTDLWLQGALHGRSADEAFHVLCDAGDTTAPGTLNLDVGIAAVRPAEFLTFRVQLVP